ncbi:MAG: DUF262 domain-containing protein [Acidimicrobiales bacterium]
MPISTSSSMQDVFRDYVLNIPQYQRGYAWATQQIAEFLSDLELLTPRTAHYAGTLILDPTDHRLSEGVEDIGGTTYRRVAVVDGQQRLTTVVILLSAIARELQSQGEDELAKGIQTTFAIQSIESNEFTKSAGPNQFRP